MMKSWFIWLIAASVIVGLLIRLKENKARIDGNWWLFDFAWEEILRPLGYALLTVTLLYQALSGTATYHPPKNTIFSPKIAATNVTDPTQSGLFEFGLQVFENYSNSPIQLDSTIRLVFVQPNGIEPYKIIDNLALFSIPATDTIGLSVFEFNIVAHEQFKSKNNLQREIARVVYPIYLDRP